MSHHFLIPAEIGNRQRPCVACGETPPGPEWPGFPSRERMTETSQRPWGTEGKFDRFLPFGLTLSPSRPTVTERNHLTNQTNWPGGRRTCHLSTPRPSAHACAPSAHSRASLCTE